MEEKNTPGTRAFALAVNAATILLPAVVLGAMTSSWGVFFGVAAIVFVLAWVTDWSRQRGWKGVDAGDVRTHEEAANRFDRW